MIHQADTLELHAATPGDEKSAVLFSAGSYEDDFLKFFASLEDVRAKDSNFDGDFKHVLKVGREEVLRTAPTLRSKAVFYPVD